jgi:hypothetical protein
LRQNSSAMQRVRSQGAVQSRIGRIHAAHGGTLFLDEIGDMPLSLQSKMLRFLEQGEVQRLGGNDNLKVDVRVVAATNADLKKRIADMQFREDLYYRLAVFPIHLPPCASGWTTWKTWPSHSRQIPSRSFAQPGSAADSEAAHVAWKRARVKKHN